MAYPYDLTNTAVKGAVAACGYSSARSGGQLQCDSSSNCCETGASSAATLLVCDTWFDVTLSAGGREQLTALATAVLVELPLAVACVFVARESEQMAERARGYVARVRRLHLRGRR